VKTDMQAAPRAGYGGPRRVRRAAVALAALVLAGGAQAQLKDSAVTLYGGYRDGGSFTDEANGRRLRLDSAGSGAASLDLGLDGSRQLQVYVAHQRTRLAVAPVASAPTTLPVRISYLHLGGTNFFDGPIGAGPYVAGGLGATLFEPGLAGYSNELKPSLNLGIGWQFTLGQQVALRLEARGYATLVNSSGGLFCSGGCTLQIKGDTVTQGEVQLGLSFRF
jgi:hypothetical protein